MTEKFRITTTYHFVQQYKKETIQVTSIFAFLNHVSYLANPIQNGKYFKPAKSKRNFDKLSLTWSKRWNLFLPVFPPFTNVFSKPFFFQGHYTWELCGEGLKEKGKNI